MAGIAEGVATNLFERVIDGVLVLIKRQLNYLCCFRNNVKCLTDEAKRLDDARVELQCKVDAIRSNGQDIAPTVTTWLTETVQIQEDKEKLEDEISKVGCISVVSRYSLSRKAKKTSEGMKLLRECEFVDDRVGLPRLPPSVAPATSNLEGIVEFISRKQILDDIFKALQDNKDKKIGIYGMGGVGKTTMVKDIMNRARSENLFKEIIMVVVSQSVDIFKIQGELGEHLGLKDLEDKKFLSTRADALRGRLTTNHTLIVLDDVWEKLEMEHIGIPCESGSQGCTVLFTSRDSEMLKQMDATTFGVECLSEEEAWSLFKVKAGSCMDDPDLASIGKDVVKECKGLPVAIVTVGGALKGKRTPIWQDALRQLKSPITTSIPTILKDVYKPLRVSYDNLEEFDAKEFFLMCCLFPDDYNISLDDLTMYMVGLQVFKGIRCLTEMRNRAISLVHILKSRSLLLDGEKECVKMHDVIRDVAICIASDEGKIADSGNNDQKWISIFEDSSDYLMRSNYQSLQLLLVHAQPKVEELPSLEEMTCLNVLSVKMLSSKKLTQVIEHSILPKSLRTLEFFKCDSISDISVVGELTSLDIFRCVECWGIEQLPTEIGNLKLLKLLDITCCKNLKKIPPGVICKLVELEELKMRDSFNKWESRNVNGEKRENVSLTELESLHKLKWLEIGINDGSLLAEKIHLPNDIVKYDLCVGRSKWIDTKHYEKQVTITTEIGIRERWFQKFLSNVESLFLSGRFSKLDLSIDLSQVQKFRSLLIDKCRTTNIVNEEKVYMFQMSSDAFLHLEDIILRNMDDIEGVFFNKEHNNHFTFPKLEKLQVSDMPNLTTFCEGLESIEFPLLHSLTIESCPKLINILSSPNLISCKHFFCNKKVIFKKLEKVVIKGQLNNSLWCQQASVFFNQLVKLEISKCDDIRSLFTFSISGKLVHLQQLSVAHCDRIETVIGNEDEGKLSDAKKARSENATHLTFPKLEELVFGYLPSLKTFCEGSGSIDFPVVKMLRIFHCPKFVDIISSHQNLADGRSSESLHLFCHDKVKFKELTNINICQYGDPISNLWCPNTSPNLFRGLRSLSIDDCGAIKKLFPSSIVRYLENLETLIIEDCNEMEKVIIEDEEMGDGILEMFPSLQSLTFRNLPKLRTFYERKSPLKLPLLRRLEINNCDQMECITSQSGFLDAPRLEGISKDWWSQNEYTTNKEGWNETVRRIYQEKAVSRICKDFESATHTFFKEEGFLEIDEYDDNGESCAIVEKGEAVASLYKSIQPTQKQMTSLLKELNEDIEKLKKTNQLGEIISTDDWAWDLLKSEQFISLWIEFQMVVVRDILEAFEDRKKCSSQTDIDSTVIAIKNKVEALDPLLKYAKDVKIKIRTVTTELNKAMVKLEEDGKVHCAKDFFVNQAFLSLSMKFKEERWTQLYNFWPSENNLGMVKVEVAFVDIHDVMHGVEAYVKFLCKWLLENLDSQQEFMKRIGDEKAIERLQAVLELKFHQITYTEVIHVVKEAFHDRKIENEVEWGMNLCLEHERYLVEEKFNSPIFVYNYPKTSKSFYMKVNDDGKTVASMELLLPKVGKLVSGGQREENSEVFKNNILEAGFPIGAYDWYLEIMSYKNIKHVGFQLLFDPLFLFVTGMDSAELRKILDIRKHRDG